MLDMMNECNDDNEDTEEQQQQKRQQPIWFVEFGCGTAKLSDHVSLQLPACRQSQCRFILIDRQTLSASRIRDGAIRARGGAAASVQRVIQDIATVSLHSLLLPSLHERGSRRSKSIVAMSKHLCGAAVEYTLQCLEDYSNHSGASFVHGAAANPKPQPWIPLAVATCCHYSCELDSSYRQAMDFWTRLGLTECDWHVLVTVSQWASLKNESTVTNVDKGESLGAMNDTVVETADTAPTVADGSFPPPLPLVPLPCDIPADVWNSFVDSDHFERSFARSAKQALGLQCKRVLDTARAHRLLAMGYDRVDLVAYTTRSVEQHLLLAMP
jgi:Methyltransferase TRM13